MAGALRSMSWRQTPCGPSIDARNLRTVSATAFPAVLWDQQLTEKVAEAAEFAPPHVWRTAAAPWNSVVLCWG